MVWRRALQRVGWSDVRRVGVTGDELVAVKAGHVGYWTAVQWAAKTAVAWAVVRAVVRADGRAATTVCG